MIYHLNIRSQLKAYFSLSFDCFLNYLFLGILLLTFFFYLSFYRGLKIFYEKSNKIRFF